MADAEPLGQWTQRLDVVIRGHRIDHDSEAECHLANVINSFHNVEIASFAMTFSPRDHFSRMPTSILIALQRSASSLRVLDWSTNVLGPQVPDIVELLKRSPQLRILHLPYFLWFNTSLPEFNFSSLNTLALPLPPSLDSYPPEGDLQRARVSLREVILTVESIEPVVNSWREFMFCYGVSITSVHLHDAIFFSTEVRVRDAIFSECLDVYLDMVNRCCPNLRKLTLSLRSLLVMSLADLHLPPIECLVLIVLAPQRRSAYRNLLLSLATLKDRTPSLRVVQFLDFRNVECLPKLHSRTVTRALERDLAGCKLRIEDHEGNLLLDGIKDRGHV
ncbi:hypothetical protein EDC04DRAFT_2905061 [Pisolithus marmoratus]|nr:hypothetical protein EDC04DRAFT_2905061 [Pisolithus marmoratus]